VRVLFAFVFLLAQAVTPQAPATEKPAPPADPASSQFTSHAGLLLVTVKPTSVADYELVIQTLQAALAKETDARRAAAAKGWFVYKAVESDAKGNAIFIHMLAPAVPEFDYRPSLLLDELVKDLAPDLLTKYQDAFAAPPTKLSLAEFARMSVAPAPAPPPKKPGGRR
jgi:hypothetical protein